MASEELIDLSAIDLKATVADAAAIERLNPHRGLMRLLDRVIWLAPDRSAAVGAKEVTEHEFWVPGHIPGRPLMPGVLMIEAAAQLSSYLFKVKTAEERFLGFTHVDKTSFRGQVVPGDTLFLVVKEVLFRPRRFTCDAQGFVNGRIAFETRISGMVF
ncbi:MAG: beta-hydroxyacyl-ACP dehydratase [Phycisphaerales bacterium]|nr:beta-hydroxyacyl-ACP dehydratase [Phycisphaerales bacterium]